MNLPEAQSSRIDADTWALRRRNNVRLGWMFAAFAVVLFLVALWKYRPL
jgi:hypothetical protein